MASPASRGIGLALARRLLQTTDLPVVATARADVPATRGHILNGLDVDGDRLTVLEADVTGTSTCLTLKQFISRTDQLTAI